MPVAPSLRSVKVAACLEVAERRRTNLWPKEPAPKAWAEGCGDGSSLAVLLVMILSAVLRELEQLDEPQHHGNVFNVRRKSLPQPARNDPAFDAFAGALIVHGQPP